MEYVNTFDTKVEGHLARAFKRPTLIRGLVHLLLALYVARLAPNLPKQVLVLFDNGYFKLLMFSLVLWTAQFSPSTSLLISIAFMVTLNYANQKPLFEFLENTEDETATPIAPNAQVAIDTASATVEEQNTNATVVNAVAQKQETVVVQPVIVDTPSGPTVFNPSVVVAPAIVSTPNGEIISVQPDVKFIDAPSKQPSAPATQADSGCYPIRKYDMSKVSAFTTTSYSEL